MTTLHLKGLSIFTELEGKKFSELGDLKSELETTTIRCIVLRKDNRKELSKRNFCQTKSRCS
jgi:sporulation protein YlmC with PRC-barrel domain